MSETFLLRTSWKKVAHSDKDIMPVRIAAEHRNITKVMVYYRDVNTPATVSYLELLATTMAGAARFPDNTILNLPNYIRPLWIRSDWYGDTTDDPNHYARDVDYNLKALRIR